MLSTLRLTSIFVLLLKKQWKKKFKFWKLFNWGYKINQKRLLEVRRNLKAVAEQISMTHMFNTVKNLAAGLYL